MLIVVRHARPVIDGDRPPAEWPLSDAGETDAAALGALIRERVVRPRLLSSPEVKALATAQACFPGEPIVGDERLAEVTKPWFDDAADLYGATAAYLAGEPLDGWEDAEAVARRFDHCLSGLGQHGDVVAFTHGTSLAVWLSRRRHLAEPFTWWTDLRTPDAWVVGVAGDGLVRVDDRPHQG